MERAYWKEGRTRKQISFLSQASCSVGAVASRGDASSHTTWIIWQSSSQKGSLNSRKILLLVPKPNSLMASAFSAGSGSSKKVSRHSLRKSGIHNWTRLTPLKCLKWNQWPQGHLWPCQRERPPDTPCPLGTQSLSGRTTVEGRGRPCGHLLGQGQFTQCVQKFHRDRVHS